MPTLSPSELASISGTTLEHYNSDAEGFWLGTRDHDVSQNIAALLDALSAEPPCRILDFGCGPGRDLITLSHAGHQPTGLDGAQRFCEMARANSGCPVLHQDFLQLDLPECEFHGVFANASLFHVPGQELPRVLRELWATLLPGGVLFSSNPRGQNVEGWQSDRYGAYHDLATWTHYLQDAGFQPIGHYYRPAGRPRHQQPWLASTWRKAET
jgi:SAM-dependent methyltransferase